MTRYQAHPTRKGESYQLKPDSNAQAVRWVVGAIVALLACFAAAIVDIR